MKNFEQFGVQELNAVEVKNINGGEDYKGRYNTGNPIIYFLEAVSEAVVLVGEGVKALGKACSGAHQSHGK